ncbi:MAG: hypothetical protein AAFP69_14490 [Planctomycetota bacterium]
MFLRLLPVGEDRLIALGGTGGFTGRTSVVESLTVAPSTPVDEKIVSWSVPYVGETKHSQALVMVGTKLYAFGGNKSWQPHDFSRGAFSSEAFAFDIANQRVARLPDMPFPLQSGAGVLNRQTSEHETIVVAGGMNSGDTKFAAINSVLEFDPATKQWSSASTPLPSERAMAGAVAHDDALWFFGGSDVSGGDGGLRDRVLHWWGDTTNIAPLPDVAVPHPRRSFAGAKIGDEYFMIGGLGEGMLIESSIDVFNMTDRSWRTIASPASSRVFPSVAVDGKMIYLFGGFSNDDGQFKECPKLEVYDSESDSWTTMSESIAGVDASMRLFNVSGRLLFFGIDREKEGRAKFVLFDPNPTAEPQAVAAMSFGGFGRRSSQATANAKMLMRKDTDKDGKLSASELGKRMSAFAKAADTDGDTLVSFAEAEAKMKADEEAEKKLEAAASKQAETKQAGAEQSEANTADERSDDSAADQAMTDAEGAQRKADELQRAADVAQRKADKAQREADRLRRSSK